MATKQHPAITHPRASARTGEACAPGGFVARPALTNEPQLDELGPDHPIPTFAAMTPGKPGSDRCAWCRNSEAESVRRASECASFFGGSVASGPESVLIGAVCRAWARGLRREAEHEVESSTNRPCGQEQLWPARLQGRACKADRQARRTTERAGQHRAKCARREASAEGSPRAQSPLNARLRQTRRQRNARGTRGAPGSCFLTQASGTLLARRRGVTEVHT